jgi:hypothetical protein
MVDIVGSRAASAKALMRIWLPTVARDVQCVRSILESLDGGRNILHAPNFNAGRIEAERTGECLNLTHLQHDRWQAAIAHDRQPAETGDDLAQDFEPLACKVGRLVRQAGNVAARSRQTRNVSAANRIIRCPEHDRNDRCRLHRRTDPASRRDNESVVGYSQRCRPKRKPILCPQHPQYRP